MTFCPLLCYFVLFLYEVTILGFLIEIPGPAQKPKIRNDINDDDEFELSVNLKVLVFSLSYY